MTRYRGYAITRAFCSSYTVRGVSLGVGGRMRSSGMTGFSLSFSSRRVVDVERRVCFARLVHAERVIASKGTDGTNRTDVLTQNNGGVRPPSHGFFF